MTGQQLRQRRTRRLRLSQERLARALGMSVFTISRYEQGRVVIPKVVELAVRWLCDPKARPTRRA